MSLLSNYRLRSLQKFKIRENMANLSYIQRQANMVLARGEQNTIALYDTSLTPDRNDGIEFFEPLLLMEGHHTSGFGMDWNQDNEAVAISSSFDGTICIWDISNASKLDAIVRPLSKTTLTSGGIYDIKWHKKHTHVFAYTSSLGDIFLYTWFIEIRPKIVERETHIVVSRKTKNRETSA